MSTRELIGDQDNVYYEVVGDDDLAVWSIGDYEPTNSYYGASQIHRATYNTLLMRPGDQIHWLVGGLFFVGFTERGILQVYEGRVDESDPDKSPFERIYGDPHTPQRNRIAKLIADNKVRQITTDKATKVEQYRRFSNQ